MGVGAPPAGGMRSRIASPAPMISGAKGATLLSAQSGALEQDHLTLAPTTLSHCLVIAGFETASWSSVGNTALA